LPLAKILAQSGKSLSLNPQVKIDSVINGLNLSGFNSGYSVFNGLLMIFKPFTAYALNLLMMSLAGFWGMALLLKHFIIKDRKHETIVIGTSLCFSLLTFYPPAGISIAGFPLLLYCFLKIKNRQTKIWHFIYVLIFPFHSLFHHAGFFILITLVVIFTADLYKTRKFNRNYMLALSLLSAGYIFSHFHLFYSLFDPDFVSFREEIRVQSNQTIECLKNTIHNFIFDRTNSVSGQQLFIMLTLAGALALSFFKPNEKVNRLMFFTILVSLNSIIWGFKYWTGLDPIRESCQFLNAYNFARSFWLNPVLWYIIFALSLTIISNKKYGKTLALTLITGQLLFLFCSYNLEYRSWIGLRNRVHSSLTFGQFYSKDLFRQIQRHIGRPQANYRILSLGIHPGIAQYNEFYTLDIYATVYPVSYKHRFRQIIEREIEKSPELVEVFDHNAKRCYLLSAELHGDKIIRGMANARGITKNEQYLKIRNLDLNTAALKEMGGEYIFSGVEIVNHEENSLRLEGIFENDKSPWKIYLYRVI